MSLINARLLAAVKNFGADAGASAWFSIRPRIFALPLSTLASRSCDVTVASYDWHAIADISFYRFCDRGGVSGQALGKLSARKTTNR
jgi:hypothetical protein